MCAEAEAEERISDAVDRIAKRWPVLARDDVKPLVVEALMEAVEDMPAEVIRGWLMQEARDVR